MGVVGCFFFFFFFFFTKYSEQFVIEIDFTCLKKIVTQIDLQ